MLSVAAGATLIAAASNNVIKMIDASTLLERRAGVQNWGAAGGGGARLMPSSVSLGDSASG